MPGRRATELACRYPKRNPTCVRGHTLRDRSQPTLPLATGPRKRRLPARAGGIRRPVAPLALFARANASVDNHH